VELVGMLDERRRVDTSEQLTLLVDELLGALDDTARLAADLCFDWHWQVQLAYLRDLQRLGRETLAAAAAHESRTNGPLPARSGPARPCMPARAHRAGPAWRFRSSVRRRGARRCARNGHDEGPA
jgi:hypothetical protein